MNTIRSIMQPPANQSQPPRNGDTTPRGAQAGTELAGRAGTRGVEGAHRFRIPKASAEGNPGQVAFVQPGHHGDSPGAWELAGMALVSLTALGLPLGWTGWVLDQVWGWL